MSISLLFVVTVAKIVYLLFRQKLGNQAEDSVLIQSLQNGHAIEFERSDATRKLRLFLSELLTLMSLVCQKFIIFI